MGSKAFQDDAETFFGDDIVSIGEWVIYRLGDTSSLNVNGYPCRMMKDTSVRMTVKDPNMVF